MLLMYVYYVEVNLICIIILVLFRQQLKNTKTSSADQRILNLIIWIAILFCASDLIAGVSRGATFTGARAVIQASNLIYFEAIAIISYLWNIYVSIRLEEKKASTLRYYLISAIPLAIFTIAALINPFTSFIFKINENNLYERGIGIYLHWAIIWPYFIVASVKALRAYLREKNTLKKREIAPLLYFMIAPAVASVTQMLFYGVTSSQVGITISVVMICLSYQDAQVLTDALTGINNRRGFDSYMSSNMQRNEDVTYTIVMMDIDGFKHINDKYGHMVGDRALKCTAEALKHACKVVTKRMYLCRFGGDEFILVGMDCDKDEIKNLRATIASEIDVSEKDYDLPCNIKISVGISDGTCTTEQELKALIEVADKAMYDEKTIKR